jgi:hypothetical protein
MADSSEPSSTDTTPATSDVAARLAAAEAQIAELIEINKGLRSELGEMTVMWVSALGKSRKPLHAIRQAVTALRNSFAIGGPPAATPIKRSVRDYQMLGALSALQQGRHTGLVIPTVELLALGYAMEVDDGIWISPAGEDVLKGLRASLLNTGQHPVVIAD